MKHQLEITERCAAAIRAAFVACDLEVARATANAQARRNAVMDGLVGEQLASRGLEVAQASSFLLDKLRLVVDDGKPDEAPK